MTAFPTRQADPGWQEDGSNDNFSQTGDGFVIFFLYGIHCCFCHAAAKPDII